MLHFYVYRRTGRRGNVVPMVVGGILLKLVLVLIYYVTLVMRKAVVVDVRVVVADFAAEHDDLLAIFVVCYSCY